MYIVDKYMTSMSPSNKKITKFDRETSYFNLPIIQDFISGIPTKPSKLKAKDKEKMGPFERFWDIVDWKKMDLIIYRTQHQIYSLPNNCINFQDEIINSNIAKLLAVRRVGFINRGRKTAGLDGFKKPTKMGAIIIASKLKVDGKATNIKRVWISKPKTKEKRPLGIPTFRDRAKQMLVKMALEPQWEAFFDPRSFGFRPGRKCHDATWNIRNVLRTGPRYIYDADIEKCFDKISHNYLIEKIKSKGIDEFHPITLQLRSWLRAGILDPKEEHIIYQEAGTAQGGVISPLLCNIALHGMHEYIIENLKLKKVRYNQIISVKLYTYADDLILICRHKRVLFLCIALIDEFLEKIGLNIKAKKTRKVHTTNKAITYTISLIDKIDQDGKYIFKKDEIYLPVRYGVKHRIPVTNSFNFLGFKFFCYNVGKHRLINLGKGAFSHVNILVTPTIDSMKKHFSVVRKILRSCTTALMVIKKVSPIIRGWLNYYSKSDARTAGLVGLLRTRMNLILLNWQKRVFNTRKRKSSLWVSVKGDKWRFYAERPKDDKDENLTQSQNPEKISISSNKSKKTKLKDTDENLDNKILLPSHSEPNYSLISYKPIRGKSSFYDGDIEYWSIKLKTILNLSPKFTKILARQHAICPECGIKINIFDDPVESTIKVGKKNKDTVLHKACKTSFTYKNK
uniref:Reverse transcriptase domain-containing protein n=1 Tax=Trachelomonas grandis TaxID=215769 RepID=A0A385UJQ7_9EUGL|nr:hypothetical protein [Trachelomonas grandis]